ncbi:3-phosphoshikimate 1-carboxyvinyltransferase [Paludibacter sp.]|uniref:3-phosphoshikimate 1-carboxyvinyltransferase n=1 Tax=Paludibacter sp. TaxID=1898105 RepID=UPI0013526F1C|nr:3-phosphoshikimate 1-carboxyvinyltransferase [Paludibacter sp.]MTK52193.1 3-phosphoshikimate 1-carboxyvinyltransferase [Paludibacter sp.]
MIRLFPPTTQPVTGSIDLPASKSISNRALILSMLSKSTKEISHLADCDDTKVMLETLKLDKTTFDIGAAGTSMRFLTAYLSNLQGNWILTGSERMKNRPIGVLIDALNHLGADIEYIEKEGYPPLRISGKALQGGKIRLAGNISSQYISALLMIAPTMKNGLEMTLEGKIISIPYIRMTLHMMEEFGVSAKWEGQTITIPHQEYRPIAFHVESDWSAASYWYAIAALSGNSCFKLYGLKQDSTQGDSQVAKIFESLGIKSEFTPEGVIISNDSTPVSVFNYDFINQPDLAQTVVVCCCLLNIPFSFSGLQTLKIKETDRIAALKNEMVKLGYILEEPEDGMLSWNGLRTNPDYKQAICTYEDHRMAMAFAPAALIHPIKIEHPEVVSKSYPGFWQDLQSVGFTIE